MIKGKGHIDKLVNEKLKDFHYDYFPDYWSKMQDKMLVANSLTTLPAANTFSILKIFILSLTAVIVSAIVISSVMFLEQSDAVGQMIAPNAKNAKDSNKIEESYRNAYKNNKESIIPIANNLEKSPKINYSTQSKHEVLSDIDGPDSGIKNARSSEQSIPADIINCKRNTSLNSNLKKNENISTLEKNQKLVDNAISEDKEIKKDEYKNRNEKLKNEKTTVYVSQLDKKKSIKRPFRKSRVLSRNLGRLSVGFMFSTDFLSFDEAYAYGDNHPIESRLGYSIGPIFTHKISKGIDMQYGVQYTGKRVLVDYNFITTVPDDPAVPDHTGYNLSYLKIGASGIISLLEKKSFRFNTMLGIATEIFLGKSAVTSYPNNATVDEEVIDAKGFNTLYSASFGAGFDYFITKRICFTLSPEIRYNIRRKFTNYTDNYSFNTFDENNSPYKIKSKSFSYGIVSGFRFYF